MEDRNKMHPVVIMLSTAAMLGIASAAVADPGKAVDGCIVAITDEQGRKLVPRLRKIQARGRSYEAWFNLKDGDERLKAYCVKKGNTYEVITSDGSWKRWNPKRPG
jgi:hypothetical protein